MVTYAQLRELDVSVVDDAASNANTLSGDLDGYAADVSGYYVPPAIWDGLDMIAAEGKIGDQSPPLSDASASFDSATGALEGLAEGLRDAQAKLDDAHEAVAGTPVTIDSDGNVSYPPPAETLTPDRAEGYVERCEAAMQNAVDLIEEALELAAQADEDAANALHEGDSFAPENPSRSSIPDGPGDTAQDVSDWWDGLSQAERDQYVEAYPEIIGNLDGIAPADRDAANRISLEAAIEEAEEQLEELEAMEDDGLRPNESKGTLESVDMAIEAMERKIEGLGAVQDALDENEDYLLLGFDAELNGRDSGDGRTIIATGDPSAADNVYTHVPGASTDLAGAAGSMGRVESVLDETSGNTVGVMWFDYDAPDGLLRPNGQNAFNHDFGIEGADGFDSYLDGIRAVNPDAHSSVAAHSYAGTLLGETAARHGGLNADSVVFLGAPDNIGVDHADDLGVENVYSAAEPKDVAWWLGGDAALGQPLPHNNSFGAQELPTENVGHSGYWNDQTSLESLSAIADGGTPRTPEPEGPTPFEDREGWTIGGP